MHYAKQVYAPPKVQNDDRDKLLKWDGSFIHCPLVSQPISVTNHQILKTQVNETATHNESDTGFNGVMKFFNLKDNKSLKMLYRRHLRIDIKKYLKKKFGKPMHLIPNQAFECVRFCPKQSEEKQLCKTNIFYLYQPYYLMKNIRSYLFKDSQNKRTPDEIKDYSFQLLSLSLSYGGLDNFIMTTSNVYIETDLQTLKINYNSFVGLKFLVMENERVTVSRNQFLQIYPYLDSQIMKRPPQQRINYQLKIRCFLINILALITGQDIQFMTQFFKEGQLDRDSNDVNDAINKIKNQFSTYLNSKYNKKRIKKISQKTDIQFDKLFERALEKQEKLNWEDVIEYFRQKPTETDKKDEKIFQQFHKELWELQDQKQYYIDRKIDSPLLYIPIKFNANLSKILRLDRWWHVFTHPQQYNDFHSFFSFKLMDQVVNKIQKDIRDNDIKKSIQEYSEVGKYIMQCWRRSWNEYLTSDANIRICSYSEYWKELFGDQKEEDK